MLVFEVTFTFYLDEHNLSQKPFIKHQISGERYQEHWSSGWLSWADIFEALFGCHDMLILGTSPIKWRQRPDIAIAVDWDVKHQCKQRNKV